MHFIFPIANGSMKRSVELAGLSMELVGPSMELVGLSTSNKVKNHCSMLSDAALLSTWPSMKVKYVTL